MSKRFGLSTVSTSKKLRVAIAQINPTVGDLTGNTQKIIEFIETARSNDVDLIIFPELAVSGFPLDDLLLNCSFLEINGNAIEQIAAHTSDITAIVGYVSSENCSAYNSAAVINNCRIAGVVDKVFFENKTAINQNRHFTAGNRTSVYRIGDVTLCVTIGAGDYRSGIPKGIDCLVNIVCSPFHAGKWMERDTELANIASENNCTVIYVNSTGAQEDYVYDGHSLILDASANVIFRCKQFEEQLAIVDLPITSSTRQVLLPESKTEPIILDQKTIFDLSEDAAISSSSTPLDRVAEIYQALVTGTRDYVRKNGFNNVLLGLSGGIDSALVACIAVDALGAGNVRVLVMPSEYSSEETQSDALLMAKNLNLDFDYIPIIDIFNTYNNALAGVFDGIEQDVTEENLQARIRGNILMALSNKFGSLVLTTSNKSEAACGYSTLYGDMAGGFSMLKDVSKTLVYELSYFRNQFGSPIPASIIERAPSAELRPNQTDQDSLPEYDVLDAILHLYVEKALSAKEIIALGWEEKTVCRVARLVDVNEYKRRQITPGVKITPRVFGVEHRLPITSAFREK